MTFSIDFQKREIYESLDAGITINAILRYGHLETFCEAKIDTGSQVCLFSRILADALEIDVESGYRKSFSTLGGGVFAYAHEVE
ncbi:MAG TPA: aspartyl protease family protein [Pyrinomonadaceae bacterium]|nr:aspartyl protease family protein [Pyrinomonadaceae bacterium]